MVGDSDVVADPKLTQLALTAGSSVGLASTSSVTTSPGVFVYPLYSNVASIRAISIAVPLAGPNVHPAPIPPSPSTPSLIAPIKFLVAAMFPHSFCRDQEQDALAPRRRSQHANERRRTLSRICGETVAVMWGRPATS